MRKWNSSTLAASKGFPQQRKSVQLRASLSKKCTKARLSYKGYLNNRIATDPDDPFPITKNFNSTQKQNNFCFSGSKGTAPNKVETNLRYLVGRKHHIPFKQRCYNINRESTSQNHTQEINNPSFNQDCDNISYLKPNLVISDSKWKKSRMKPEHSFCKLKEIQHFIKTRKKTERDENLKKMNDLKNNSLLKENQKAAKEEEEKSSESDSIIQEGLFLGKENNKRGVSEENHMKPSPRNLFIHKEKNRKVSFKSGTRFSEKQSKKQKQIQETNLVTISQIGAGTFGQVYTVQDRQSGLFYAVKKILDDKSHKNRQIEIMNLVKSPFVIEKLKNYSTYTTDNTRLEKEYIHILMPKYESNFYQFFKKTSYQISGSLFKIFMYQVFRGILHLHSRNICHRDLKPQNILIKGSRIVICDLGSAKILKPQEQNIAYICSRCYRAPELIFGNTRYSLAIDIWSAGCIILEFLNKNPLFIGKDSLNHLIEVFKVLGTPSQEQIQSMNPLYDHCSFRIPKMKPKQWFQIIPDMDPLLNDLIDKIMIYNPSRRLSAGEVLVHPYFDEIREEGFMKMAMQKYSLDIRGFFQFDQKQQKMLEDWQELVPEWATH